MNLSDIGLPTFLLVITCVLSYLYIDLKVDYGIMSDQLSKIKTQIVKVEKVNDVNRVPYEKQEKTNKQLIKDASRSHLLLKKSTLVERKINDSFKQYMDDFENE
ncbi:I-spanin [Morganella phage vB_Mm5]